MKSVLLLASVASIIDQFNMSNIRLLKEMGYAVEVAANFKKGNSSSPQRLQAFQKELEAEGITYYQVDFSRKVTHIAGHIKAYRQLKKIMAQKKYDFVHCHSPIGGVCGRLAARKTNTRVMYTAHGFHFYKGAPLLHWLLYYPIERALARHTHMLLTINKEDYQRALKFKAPKVYYLPGVGVNTQRFAHGTDKTQIRKALELSENALVMLSVGELNKNKNHAVIIKALKKINNPRFVYLICGIGRREKALKKLAASLGLSEQVRFLGFRSDVDKLYRAADIFIFPSYREGLSLALMEAMASGLPCVVSRIRGNTDLIDTDAGGFLLKPRDTAGFAQKIKWLAENAEKREDFARYNMQKIKSFDADLVNKKMRDIYREIAQSSF